MFKNHINLDVFTIYSAMLAVTYEVNSSFQSKVMYYQSWQIGCVWKAPFANPVTYVIVYMCHIYVELQMCSVYNISTL